VNYRNEMAIGRKVGVVAKLKRWEHLSKRGKEKKKE